MLYYSYRKRVNVNQSNDRPQAGKETNIERYDYLEAVTADVLEYIKNEANLSDYHSREELEEALNDNLWAVDSVTGNASGSYWFSTWKAEKALSHNLDLLAEALKEFGQDGPDVLKQGAEAMDVTIRCYLLGQAIAEALDDLEEEFPWDEE